MNIRILDENRKRRSVPFGWLCPATFIRMKPLEWLKESLLRLFAGGDRAVASHLMETGIFL